MSPKLQYLITSLRKQLLRTGQACPSCGFDSSSSIVSKYVITQLRRCNRCSLQFRCPTTSKAESESFYQTEYEQGFTTELPDEDSLRSLLNGSFKGTEKDYTPYIEVLRALGCRPNDTLLDFGCSWGYGSWQLANAGFLVSAFEVSATRCEYARERLRVDAHDSLGKLKGPFHVFFSSHVLEHLPSVHECFEVAKKLLIPGGLFVAFTPNGSDEYRRLAPGSWNKLWGRVHPNHLDDRFYSEAFQDTSYLLASNPYSLHELRDWRRTGVRKLRLEGVELLAVSVF